MKNQDLIPLASFFFMNPEWFNKVRMAHEELNDTVSYSSELWADIVFYFITTEPVSNTDLVWDEILTKQGFLQKFSRLKKIGFFNQKAP
jgi:hypothetical protein